MGAGFGGLTFCQRFRHENARITLVDRQNHHLFQPLLYQVATAGLAAPDIAEPIRSILSRRRDITVLLDTVVGIDVERKRVTLRRGELDFDYLVVALGARTSYFGHPEWAEFAPGLKSLDDAVRIRRDVLMAFELAESETDESRRRRLMTVAVIGGGPTGVEVAGAFAELSRHVLKRDFRHIDPTQAHVVLIEGGARVLAGFSEKLSGEAEAQLRKLGVDVQTKALVKDIGPGRIDLRDGRTIRAANMIWAAGVAANPLIKELGVETDRAGRACVRPDLSIPEFPCIFAIGDNVTVYQSDDRPVPGVSPAAMQMAGHVARVIRAELAGTSASTEARPSFSYFDKGSMATIGRSAAVAQIGKLEFSGHFAWLAWLFVHLMFLVGFENRLVVLLQWAYSYFTYRKGARIIAGGSESPDLKAVTAGSVAPK